MARLACVALFAAVALAAAAPNPSTILDIAESLPQFSILVSVAAKTGLAPLLSAPGLKTVYAPTNDAFAALGNNTLAWITNDRNQQHLLATLYYHMSPGSITSNYFSTLSGPVNTFDKSDRGTETVDITGTPGSYKVNYASIISQDVIASNGAIQVINKVLVPSNIGLPTKDIVQTAISTPVLSVLVKAVVAAGLATALSQPNGPYTVFAPLDSAFAAVPASVLSCLLSNQAALQQVLLSHVVSGLVYSDDIAPNSVVRTLSGKTLTLGFAGPKVTINFGSSFPVSNVVLADVDTSNGAVHVIDRVIFDGTGPCAL